MNMYTTVKISHVITTIAEVTDTNGYTVGVLEVFLPETEGWTRKQEREWISKNNKRMKAICKFLNDNKL